LKIYTKTGDDGGTGLFGGPRVGKDDPRIEAYGTVDELNSVLGNARAVGLPAAIDLLIEQIQNSLFAVGAELATPDPAAHGTNWTGLAQIAALEEMIDQFDGPLPALRQFILPGGTPAAAALHVARSVCRRAERRVVTLARAEPKVAASSIVVYLNRLGDLLFVLARAANHAAGEADVAWHKPA
jgi:cob(I)alamin adenosyltransferase